MPDEDNYASTVLPVVTRMIGVINQPFAEQRTRPKRKPTEKPATKVTDGPPGRS
jgi:hypothetical protein